jgi:hypothetical protein
VLVLITSGCISVARNQPPQAAPTTSTLASATPGASQTPVATPAPAEPAAGITVAVDGPARPFDRRLLGTNVPAWLGPQGLASPPLRERVSALGPTLVRLPGGSWSNAYDWLGCENGDTETCYWPWAARPTDFLNFLRATGQEAIWTVSINGTANEAAALVAFFNGAVDDETPLGVDVRGRDWLTVSHWARLRAEHGNPEPLPIRLWEVGNEVYGGKAEVGPGCAPWGWEDVWTCDGVEYVTGVGGDAGRREGYLEFREAMRAVDPDILVGAVGVPNPNDWGNWGNEVIAAAGENLDLYVVHHYGYSEQPARIEDILRLPQQTWGPMAADLKSALAHNANGRQIPIAVTEYNLFAFQEIDTRQYMRRAVNLLYLADTIGQMAESGIVIANQWNLANGIAENGTDYGLVDAKSYALNPQYFALALWQRFGDELLPVTSAFDAERELSAYAGRGADGALSLLVINKTDEPIETSVRFESLAGTLSGTVDTVAADSLDASAVSVNGSVNPSPDLALEQSASIEPFSGALEQQFAPYSVTLIRLEQVR